MTQMPVVYRPARMDDLKRADEIVVCSINELTERRGFGKMASPRPPSFQAFSLGMILPAYGWLMRTEKSLASRGAGFAVNFGSWLSFSCRLIGKATALATG